MVQQKYTTTRHSKKRNYAEETKKCVLIPVEVAPNQAHPLKSMFETPVESADTKKMNKTTEPNNVDPLNASPSLDPLSKMVADVSFKEKVLWEI